MPDINMQHFEELQRNQYSIDVEINASQVASSQQGFPMMLETPNSSNSILNVVAINELGEQLPTEIEGVTNDKNWIYLKDLVQNVTNRKMKVFYGSSIGKPAADSAYGSEAVWDSNFVNVWHMNNNPSGSAPQLLDSTSNGNDGTSVGSMTSDDLVDTDYGKAIDFDGTDDSFTFSNTLNVNTVSIESYFSVGGKENTLRGIVGSTGWVSGDMHYQIASDNTLIFNIKSGDIGYTTASTTLFNSANYNSFFHTVGVYDGGAGTLRIYIDSNNEGTSSSIPSQSIDMNPCRIAAVYDNNRFFDGLIREIRISKIVRTQGYITTTSNNLHNPTAIGTDPFYKSISEEHNFAESLQSLGRAG